MPVSLSHIRDQLMPGLHFIKYMDKRLYKDQVPEKLEHLRRVFSIIPIKIIGDLIKLPKHIVVPDFVYETKTVFAGREYPQGWGRGPGGAAAEPLPEPDGKVDVFKEEDNENMKALKRDIAILIDEKGWERA